MLIELNTYIFIKNRKIKLLKLFSLNICFRMMINYFKLNMNELIISTITDTITDKLFLR